MAQFHRADLSGTPRERGHQHGEILRAAVCERDARWRDEIERLNNEPADQFIEAFLQGTSFLPAIERWTPDLLEEVRGIAEGSGLSFEAVLAAQFMDEEWWFGVARRQEKGDAREHCSSLGQSDPGGPVGLVAQNMDLPDWMDGSQTILRIHDPQSGLNSIVLSAAGMVGLCGVNSAGLGLCVNTLSQLSSTHDGLPVAFVSRGVLACRSVARATDFLREVKHASGQNYMIGDRGGLEDYECSAGGAVLYSPDGAPANTAWHTNHPMVSSDLPSDAAANTADSEHRLVVLNGCLAENRAAYDQAFVQSVLSNRDDAAWPVSRHVGNGSNFFTFASVIWEVSAEPVAHVAPASPCKTPYERVEMPHRAASVAAE